MTYTIGENTYTIEDIQSILDGTMEGNSPELQTAALSIQEAIDEGIEPPTSIPLPSMEVE
jgi:hypothetical protein